MAMYQRQALVVFVAALSFGYLQATPVEVCGGSVAKTHEVNISSCEVLPCILKKNTEVKISILFIPDENITDLKHDVKGSWGALNVGGFPGVDGTPANDYVFKEDSSTKADWPLRANEKYIYKNKFTVKLHFPLINVSISWKLKDSLNRRVVCFRTQAQITA